MKLVIEIDAREINAIAGQKGEDFVIEELRRDPHFFLNIASDISVFMPRTLKVAA